jgi:hypothetical protein
MVNNLEQIKQALYLFNNGSDNAEYLRGQIELAMFLLGQTEDNEQLKSELMRAAEFDIYEDKEQLQ